MRSLIILLFILITSNLVVAQHPNKTQIMSQMKEATNVINKEIADKEKKLADAKKDNADQGTIDQLDEELKMLKKQAAMMGGVGKSLSHVSNKIVRQAVDENTDAPTIIKKDVSRIKLLPDKTLTEADLSLFLKNVSTGVEKLIPIAEKTEALNIYNETKTKYKTTAIVANAGTGCWMLGHWEKALVIMGKICMEEIENADNLNNYAAFLIMTGGEQAAIPILEFLNAKYPNNSTILNNLGQAWYGLGDLQKAKKYLDNAIELYPNHSLANYTSASVALLLKDSLKSFDAPASSFPLPLSDSLKSFNPSSGFGRPIRGGSMKAINFLKASLKGSYDPDKEADLAKLGYTTTYSDLPPFNYPMQSDPFNLMQLIKLIPRQLQTNLDDPEPAYAGQRFINGVEDFYNELREEDVLLEKQAHDRASKMVTDLPYQQEFLEGHNCPAYLLAAKSVLLLNVEGIQSASSLITQLWMPFKKITGNQEIPLPPETLIQQCIKIWDQEVKTPIGKLYQTFTDDLKSVYGDCKAMDARYTAYLAQRAQIYNHGYDLIQNEFIKKSKRLQAWITLNLYAIEDAPPKKIDDFTYALVNRLPEYIARQKYRNRDLYEVALQFMELGKEYYESFSSDCKDKSNLRQMLGSQNIKQYKVTTLPCEYQKKIITPVYYEFELKCNTITEESSRLKKRKPNTKKGAAELSTATNNGGGPLQGHGPQLFFNRDMDQQSFAPLCLENKTESQCSLEYNKWGNLVGLNFQLNEDGTSLKDPDSVESGIDSRWSWNAIGSTKRSYMYRLLSPQNLTESRR